MFSSGVPEAPGADVDYEGSEGTASTVMTGISPLPRKTNRGADGKGRNAFLILRQQFIYRMLPPGPVCEESQKI